MSYFQSQTMIFCQVLFPKQLQWDLMDSIGKQNFVHMTKLQHQQCEQNIFGLNIKRCGQILLKIRESKHLIKQLYNKPYIQCENIKQILKEFDNQIQKKNINGDLYINQIEKEVNTISTFLEEQKFKITQLKQQNRILIQNVSILLTLSKFINTIQFQQHMMDTSSIINESDKSYKANKMKLEYKCGLIDRKDQMILKKTIFRICSGNILAETYEIPIQNLQELFKSEKELEFIKQKIVFFIIFQSDEPYTIQKKITKILENMGCYIDHMHLNPKNINEQFQEFKIKYIEHNSAEKIVNQCISTFLSQMAIKNKKFKYNFLSYLEIYTKKQLLIYNNLSNCILKNNIMRFQVFIPVSHLQHLKNLKTKRKDLPIVVQIKKPRKAPPTLLFTFQIIEIPQEIVDTYGIPRYKQFNPATIYIVTFGLFIGIMFGDVGHMLIGAAAILYTKANKWWWTMLFWMGYCGVIYNQFFGLNLGWTNSCYNIEENKISLKSEDCVTLFGLDPVWSVTSNKMQYINGFKMKFAVIVAIVHMTFGIIIKGINALRNRSYLDLIAVVIPQLIFLTVTFAYMDFLIIYKWTTKWQITALSPSIINNMIQMYIGHAKNSFEVYKGEFHYQTYIVYITFILIPILFLAKPIYLFLKIRCAKNKQEHLVLEHSEQINVDHTIQILNQFHQSPIKQKDLNIKEVQMHKNVQCQHDISSPPVQQIQHDNQLLHQHQSSSTYPNSQLGIQRYVPNQYEQFSEIMLHQSIQTIEFILNTVSNTASYLRLWALSLAHSQLADVFFRLILSSPFASGYSGIIQLTIFFYFFVLVTFFVLICMDIMECFLHSLRLHWVEFQNKFYDGDGYRFKPFSFEKQLTILNKQNDK